MSERGSARATAVELDDARTQSTQPLTLHTTRPFWPEDHTDPAPPLRGLPVGTSATKRIFDIFCVMATAPMTLPIAGLVVLAVKLDSSGPVLFKQRRIGRGGAPFEMYKFRSMVTHGDAVLADHFERHPTARLEWTETRKLRDDPRITRIGRWLRRTSLDELPQLLNVLRGEMSIVGPRPIIGAEVPFYRRWYPLYLEARPGLTGVWQVSGRNDLSYAQRVRMDVRYVMGWSLADDVSIVVRTVRAVLSGRGAY